MSLTPLTISQAHGWRPDSARNRARPDSREVGLECGECEGGSTAPLHSRSVRCEELNFRLSTSTFGSATKLQHIPGANQQNRQAKPLMDSFVPFVMERPP